MPFTKKNAQSKKTVVDDDYGSEFNDTFQRGQQEGKEEARKRREAEKRSEAEAARIDEESRRPDASGSNSNGNQQTLLQINRPVSSTPVNQTSAVDLQREMRKNIIRQGIRNATQLRAQCLVPGCDKPQMRDATHGRCSLHKPLEDWQIANKEAQRKMKQRVQMKKRQVNAKQKRLQTARKLKEDEELVDEVIVDVDAEIARTEREILR